MTSFHPDVQADQEKGVSQCLNMESPCSLSHWDVKLASEETFWLTLTFLCCTIRRAAFLLTLLFTAKFISLLSVSR